MRSSIRIFLPLVMMISIMTTFPAHAQEKDVALNVDSNIILKMENHTNTRNADGSFRSEVFMNHMIMSTMKITKSFIGSAFLLNRRSISDNDNVSNTGGINGIIIFSKQLIAVTGLSFTSSAARSLQSPGSDSDRFSTTFVYTLNPEAKETPKYSFTTNYSTLTNWGDQKSLSEKFAVSLPMSKVSETTLSYRLSYSMDDTEISSHQLSAKYSKKMKDSKLSFGITYFNNVYSGNNGDNVIFDVTWLYSGL